ncbi:hypothetical protein [Zooshikella ganghwensis]|uniref:hypothetical protein n=1 Tax=Zooshikella ganghwensis TaxID=202772 RepID=UPI0012F7C0F1|nr:hypothetical protein [Zooshikella ganghwensis]
MDELEALCLKDAGAIVNGIEKVDGYYLSTTKECAACVTLIGTGQYDFIEFEHDKDRSGTPVQGQPFGYYIAYKAPKGDPNCNEYFQRDLERKKGSSYYKDFYKKNCIATKKIDAFRSKYLYASTGEIWINNKIEGYEIYRSVDKVVNIKSKELLGQYTSYLLTPYSLFKRPESYMTLQCSGINKFKYKSIKKPIDTWVFGK